MKKNRLFSFLLALVLIIGVVTPNSIFATNRADADPANQAQVYDVVVHKLGVIKEKLKVTEIKEYTGGQLAQDILKKHFGESVKELADVTFTYWKIDDYTKYKTMVGNPASYDTVEKVEKFLTTKGAGTSFTTTASGFSVKGLAKGFYWFVEHKGSKLGTTGLTLSEAAAVPFGLELPVYKTDGTTFTTGENALHVYPKNTTTDKPTVEKKIDGHADNTENKSVKLGDKVPYTVTTKIKPKAQYKTAAWSDRMTEGLTFNKDIELKVNGVKLTETNDYTLVSTENGFDLSLNAEGLKKITNLDAEATITLTYSATVNNKSIVEIPESNDITFKYGNNPTTVTNTTPVPQKPTNKKITVNKTRADGTTLPAGGITVKFTLYNAQTGQVVNKQGLENPKIITATTTDQITHEFTGLDDDTEYKVVEEYNGYTAEYGKAEGGIITIKNHKDDNPQPIDPTEPKVVTGGKKFVKTNDKTGDSQERLVGARFVVKNQNGQYLVAKTAEQENQEAQDVVTKRTELKTAIDNYNKNTDDNQKEALMTKVKEAQAAYNKAILASRLAYEFKDKVGEQLPQGTVELTSGDEGRFEVTGLAEGTYSLEEIEAPKGYAKRDDLEFTITKTSYSQDPEGMKYKLTDADNTATQVVNKKVTIPQTGGIGTFIFIAAGLALMGGALFALKKNNKERA